MNRTQDPSESIVDYLTCINSMFRRYGHVDEYIKLGILTRNLASFYSTQLPTVSTIQELEDACLKLEIKKFRADSYVPPSRRRQGYVEPDLAFVSYPSISTSSSEVNVVSDTRPAKLNQRPSSNNMIVYWNCQRSGHHRQSCPEARKLLCYRCVKMDVTLKICPHCSVAGNSKRRH
ncbi:hypothetical protein HHI36_013296 [Cryptolaemus montrouzieri]|uniref:CCHC-type domain-containing protein n=1 Tax=Cryptolaemus montrouzieri TaxID=559131 RepID=A0ABD2NHV8_9CUCU